MPKSIYVDYLVEQPNSNLHHLNRLIKILNHYISIEPKDKPRGYEDHHIVPKAKSWKPEWSKEPENLLKVPAKAHYVIHHLMWKAFPDSIPMQKAFWMFCTSNRRQKITAKIYHSVKSNLNLSEETKRKISNALKR